MERNGKAPEGLLESLIGMDQENAFNTCEEHGYAVRITRKDRNNYIITHDLRFDRINLEFDNDIVSKCGLG